VRMLNLWLQPISDSSVLVQKRQSTAQTTVQIGLQYTSLFSEWTIQIAIISLKERRIIHAALTVLEIHVIKSDYSLYFGTVPPKRLSEQPVIPISVP
jgi:hypothetical protein